MRPAARMPCPTHMVIGRLPAEGWAMLLTPGSEMCARTHYKKSPQKPQHPQSQIWLRTA